jgi:hypothetical protein
VIARSVADRPIVSWKDERGENGESRFQLVSDATWPDEEISIGRYQDLAILDLDVAENSGGWLLR